MNKQSGFTLIELVVVIIILGILAATAVPKFVDLQSDARVSAMQGVKGALESAATLTYSRAAIDGQEDNSDYLMETVMFETVSHELKAVYGYPAADEFSLRIAAGLSTIDWSVEGTGPITIAAAYDDDDEALSQTDTCTITYTSSISGARPTIELDITSC